MKRKIMKLGPATMVVSLPSKWVKQINLKAGDEIELIESNGNILISNKVTTKIKKETIIQVTKENKNDIEVMLTHLYRQGFDSIIIKQATPETHDQISNTVRDLLLGFEITQREQDYWKVENIASPTEEKYPVMLRRSFLLVKEMQGLIVEAIQTNSFKKLNEAIELRKQQDKYILFCKRILTVENPKYMALEWEMLTFLRHINHAYYYLYQYMQKEKCEKDANVLNMLSKLSEYYIIYYDAYFNRDINNIHKLNALRGQYQFGECLKLINKNKNAVIYSYIREIFRLIQIGSSPTFQLILESNQSQT